MIAPPDARVFESPRSRAAYRWEILKEVCLDYGKFARDVSAQDTGERKVFRAKRERETQQLSSLLIGSQVALPAPCPHTDHLTLPGDKLRVLQQLSRCDSSRRPDKEPVYRSEPKISPR